MYTILWCSCTGVLHGFGGHADFRHRVPGRMPGQTGGTSNCLFVCLFVCSRPVNLSRVRHVIRVSKHIIIQNKLAYIFVLAINNHFLKLITVIKVGGEAMVRCLSRAMELVKVNRENANRQPQSVLKKMLWETYYYISSILNVLLFSISPEF